MVIVANGIWILVTVGTVTGTGAGTGTGGTGTGKDQPKRFHGTVNLDPIRAGRDASRIADEVIAHLVPLLGSDVTVTLEI